MEMEFQTPIDFMNGNIHLIMAIISDFSIDPPMAVFYYQTAMAMKWNIKIMVTTNVL